MVRLSAGLANKEFSFFGMTKHIQQAGSLLEVDGDREHTFFYANVLDQNVSEGKCHPNAVLIDSDVRG